LETSKTKRANLFLLGATRKQQQSAVRGFIIIFIRSSEEKVHGLTFLQNKQDKRESLFFFSNMIYKKSIVVLPVQMPPDISNHGTIPLIIYVDDYT
jgi:hypothetical protein